MRSLCSRKDRSPIDFMVRLVVGIEPQEIFTDLGCDDHFGRSSGEFFGIDQMR